MTILGADDEGRLRALLDSLGYDLDVLPCDVVNAG